MASTKVPADLSEDETIALDIVHRTPEGLQLTFSDNIAVQHTPSEFTITFAQVKQPLVTKAADYDEMRTVTADVVARIVMTPSKMAEFITTLQENWGMYQRRMKVLIEAQKNVGTTDTKQDRPSED